ncbi:MAG: alpha/beta fold hydrolase [Mycobacteriales bacterium]
MLTPVVVRTGRGLIEVAAVGSGPAVLIVHGLPGDWRQASRLADDLPDHRVLLVSRPGYGRTPLSSGRTPAQQADLYAALLGELGIGSAVVLGISGGGPSSYAFAARHPERCDGLVLACALLLPLMATPASMRRLAAVPGVWTVLNGIIRAGARVRPRREPDTTGLTPLELSLLAEPRTAAALLAFHSDRPSWLRGRGMRNDVLQFGQVIEGTVSSPAVVLHGDLDEVVPLSHGEHYAATIPGARLVVLPGLGHGVPLFARDQVIAAVRSLTAPLRHTC